MPVEKLKSLKGAVTIKAWQKDPKDPDNRKSDILIVDKTFSNLVVNLGKDTLLKTIAGPGDALSGFGTLDMIGVGDSTTIADLSDTDLVAATNKIWKTISTADKNYSRPTLFVSVDFGFTEANWTWNEVGIADSQGGTPPTIGTALLVARQIDGSPLVKDNTKRALIQWEFSL